MLEAQIQIITNFAFDNNIIYLDLKFFVPGGDPKIQGPTYVFA